MTISYSTNWCGPISMKWYRDRGLTVVETVVQEEDSILHKKGEIYDLETTIESWSGGRIDVRGTGLGPYGEEIELPIMRGDCYQRFSDWLDTFKTDDVWTLDQIVELYERDNPKIIWAHDVFDVV